MKQPSRAQQRQRLGPRDQKPRQTSESPHGGVRMPRQQAPRNAGAYNAPPPDQLFGGYGPPQQQQIPFQEFPVQDMDLELAHMRPSDRLRILADRLDGNFEPPMLGPGPQMAMQGPEMFHPQQIVDPRFDGGGFEYDDSPNFARGRALMDEGLQSMRGNGNDGRMLAPPRGGRRQQQDQQDYGMQFEEPRQGGRVANGGTRGVRGHSLGRAQQQQMMPVQQRGREDRQGGRGGEGISSQAPGAAARAAASRNIRRLPQNIFLIRQQLRWLIKRRCQQMKDCLDAVKAAGLKRSTEAGKEAPVPGFSISGIRQDYTNTFGKDLPLTSFPDCTKVSQVLEAECGDFVRPHAGSDPNNHRAKQFWTLTNPGFITPSEGESKAAKRERSNAGFAARSVHIATAVLRTVGYSGPEVVAVVEKTLGPSPAAVPKTGKDGAVAGKAAGKGGSEGAGAQGGAGKQGASTAATLADSDANAMGIASEDEDAAGEGAGAAADAVNAAAGDGDAGAGAAATVPAAVAETVGSEGVADAAATGGNARKSVDAAVSTEAASQVAAAPATVGDAAKAGTKGTTKPGVKAAEAGEAVTTSDMDVLATEAFVIAEQDVSMKAETVGTLRNVRRLIYKTLYAHLSKTPYRQVVSEGGESGKDPTKAKIEDLVLSECPELVLIERVHHKNEGKDVMDLLDLTAQRGFGHTNKSTAAVRAYDLSNFRDTYAAEYGEPLDPALTSDPDAYSSLIAMCALPATVRRAKSDGRLILVSPFGAPASLLSHAVRQLRNRVVWSLLEYVPSVRHMLGQLPGKTQHHVGEDYVATVPCKQAAARIARKYTKTGSLDALLKLLNCTSMHEVLQSVHVMDLVTHHGQAIRPAFDPLVDLRMTLDLRLAPLAEAMAGGHESHTAGRKPSYQTNSLRGDHNNLWGYAFQPVFCGRSTLEELLKDCDDMATPRVKPEHPNAQLRSLVYPSHSTLMRYHLFATYPPTEAGTELAANTVLSTFKQTYGYAHPACNAVALAALTKSMSWVFATDFKDGVLRLSPAAATSYFTLKPPPAVSTQVSVIKKALLDGRSAAPTKEAKEVKKPAAAAKPTPALNKLPAPVVRGGRAAPVPAANPAVSPARKRPAEGAGTQAVVPAKRARQAGQAGTGPVVAAQGGAQQRAVLDNRHLPSKVRGLGREGSQHQQMQPMARGIMPTQPVRIPVRNQPLVRPIPVQRQVPQQQMRSQPQHQQGGIARGGGRQAYMPSAQHELRAGAMQRGREEQPQGMRQDVKRQRVAFNDGAMPQGGPAGYAPGAGAMGGGYGQQDPNMYAQAVQQQRGSMQQGGLQQQGGGLQQQGGGMQQQGGGVQQQGGGMQQQQQGGMQQQQYQRAAVQQQAAYVDANVAPARRTEVQYTVTRADSGSLAPQQQQRGGDYGTGYEGARMGGSAMVADDGRAAAGGRYVSAAEVRVRGADADSDIVYVAVPRSELYPNGGQAGARGGAGSGGGGDASYTQRDVQVQQPQQAAATAGPVYGGVATTYANEDRGGAVWGAGGAVEGDGPAGGASQGGMQSDAYSHRQSDGRVEEGGGDWRAHDRAVQYGGGVEQAVNRAAATTGYGGGRAMQQPQRAVYEAEYQGGNAGYDNVARTGQPQTQTMYEGTQMQGNTDGGAYEAGELMGSMDANNLTMGGYGNQVQQQQQQQQQQTTTYAAQGPPRMADGYGNGDTGYSQAYPSQGYPMGGNDGGAQRGQRGTSNRPRNSGQRDRY